jgi:hypothetical protein
MSGRDRPSRLVRLDARIVPGLAASMRAVGNGGRRLGAATGAPGRLLVRLTRRSPTITAALVSVVAATALILATGGDQHHAVAPAAPNPEVVLPGNELGPIAGQPVSTYLAAAQQRREQLPLSTSNAVTAVVDLQSYLTAAAVTGVVAGLDGLRVTRAFARAAPPANGDVHAITLMPGDDLADQLTELRASAHQVAVNYRKRVAIAKAHPTVQNGQVVNAYADIARQARVDEVGLGAASRCVFALEVTGPPTELQLLAKQPDVRVLDPAPSTVAQADLMIVPLEPQVTGTVPALEFADD